MICEAYGGAKGGFSPHSVSVGERAVVKLNG